MMTFWRWLRGVFLGLSKADVHYMDHADSVEDCSLCDNYRPPHHCALVNGWISPNGYCDQFFAKSHWSDSRSLE
jgi:hypothetical protein